jgi:imidazolonepropionase-like amidohydrolase
MNNKNFDSASVMRYLAIRRKVVYECQRQCVGLLLGTDAAQVFSVPGFALHRELGYFVDAGLTPYQALRTGTHNVGKFFNRDDIGVIKQGAVADLILLDANPLENIHAIDSIKGVMLNGRWLSKKDIEEMLKRLVKS